MVSSVGVSKREVGWFEDSRRLSAAEDGWLLPERWVSSRVRRCLRAWSRVGFVVVVLKWMSEEVDSLFRFVFDVLQSPRSHHHHRCPCSTSSPRIQASSLVWASWMVLQQADTSLLATRSVVCSSACSQSRSCRYVAAALAASEVCYSSSLSSHSLQCPASAPAYRYCFSPATAATPHSSSFSLSSLSSLLPLAPPLDVCVASSRSRLPVLVHLPLPRPQRRSKR